MRPCTWKSGITSKDLSLSVNSYVTAMLCRLAARLACVSGTPFGFDVVPASTPDCLSESNGKLALGKTRLASDEQLQFS